MKYVLRLAAVYAPFHLEGHEEKKTDAKELRYVELSLREACHRVSPSHVDVL